MTTLRVIMLGKARTRNFGNINGLLHSTARRGGLPVILLSLACMHVLAADTDAQKLASANASFGFNLMKQIVGDRPTDNVFISPYSVSAALQMVWQGAAGETKAEMDQALALTNFKTETAGSAYKELDNSIKSAAAKVALDVANSIWYAPNIELKPQFISINQNLYGAKLSALDFTDPRSAGIVNSWVSEATHGKINKIVEPPLSSMTGLILANAIYFKGNWEHKFDNNATKEQPFHLRGGGQKQTRMMRQSRKFSYQEDSAFQAIRLPYVGDRLGMLVFLPSTNSSPNKFLAGLNGDAWREKIMPKFQQREGTIVLPRFKLEFKADLVRSLKAMGIQQAFSSAANFSGIVNMGLYISGVDHASFVEVNEEGTEAAAATQVTVALTSAMPTVRPFQMIVDRPFFFAIEDNTTHSILFMGLINDPGSQ
jgi:serine protease inhibitor